MSKAKTAYDMRRYITLVQVLAGELPRTKARLLCRQWGVDYPANGNFREVVRRLARHVIDYHRDEAPTKGDYRKARGVLDLGDEPVEVALRRLRGDAPTDDTEEKEG